MDDFYPVTLLPANLNNFGTGSNNNDGRADGGGRAGNDRFHEFVSVLPCRRYNFRRVRKTDEDFYALCFAFL